MVLKVGKVGGYCVVGLFVSGLVAWVIEGLPWVGGNMEDFFEGNECG